MCTVAANPNVQVVAAFVALVGAVLTVTFTMGSANPILLTFVQVLFSCEDFHGPALYLKICRNKTNQKVSLTLQMEFCSYSIE